MGSSTKFMMMGKRLHGAHAGGEGHAEGGKADGQQEHHRDHHQHLLQVVRDTDQRHEEQAG